MKNLLTMVQIHDDSNGLFVSSSSIAPDCKLHSILLKGDNSFIGPSRNLSPSMHFAHSRLFLASSNRQRRSFLALKPQFSNHFAGPSFLRACILLPTLAKSHVFSTHSI
jgi:hypothetical protein